MAIECLLEGAHGRREIAGCPAVDDAARRRGKIVGGVEPLLDLRRIGRIVALGDGHAGSSSEMDRRSIPGEDLDAVEWPGARATSGAGLPDPPVDDRLTELRPSMVLGPPDLVEELPGEEEGLAPAPVLDQGEERGGDHVPEGKALSPSPVTDEECAVRPAPVAMAPDGEPEGVALIRDAVLLETRKAVGILRGKDIVTKSTDDAEAHGVISSMGD